VLDGYIDDTEHENLKNPPPDLYLKPYPNARAKKIQHEESHEGMAKNLKTLYLSRYLKNRGDFIVWAKRQGFESVVEDPHVTVAFSKALMDWDSLGESDEEVTVTNGKRSITKLGEAVVLRFESPRLGQRWKQLKELGATWDWDEYLPHVTISYQTPPNIDLTKIEPFEGDLVFSSEVNREVDLDWKDKVKES
jgi:hypothetical protein